MIFDTYHAPYGDTIQKRMKGSVLVVGGGIAGMQTALDWSYKTDCCGASLFISSESTASRLVSKILKDAVARGADCIAVACPMCHNNLDTIQNDIRRAYDIPRPMPVLYISQLMGLSFGLNASELKLDHAFVPFTQPEYIST